MEYCVVLFSYGYSPGQVSEYSSVPFALSFQSEASQEGPLALNTAVAASSVGVFQTAACQCSECGEEDFPGIPLSVWPLQEPFFGVHT